MTTKQKATIPVGAVLRGMKSMERSLREEALRRQAQAATPAGLIAQKEDDMKNLRNAAARQRLNIKNNPRAKWRGAAGRAAEDYERRARALGKEIELLKLGE